MRIEQQTRAFLEAGKDSPPLYELPLEQAREALSQMSIMAGGPAPEVGAYEERLIACPAGDIPVRLYWPAESSRPGEAPGLLVYFHGGGFALGDASTHDGICRYLCASGGVVVVNVDYRRSPEHKFPAAPEDCYAALQWAAAEAERLGARGDRIAVAGDSAGGNLAAVVSLMARDRSGPELTLQVLIYPVVDMDPSFATPSREEFGEAGLVLTSKDIEWLAGMYVGDEADKRNPYLSPLHAASFAGLPRALVITAELDPLRDEGRSYADRLAAAGVAVEYKCYEGTVHGFVSFSGVIDLGEDALQLMADRLKQWL
jgi:acetyl esterase